MDRRSLSLAAAALLVTSCSLDRGADPRAFPEAVPAPAAIQIASPQGGIHAELRAGEGPSEYAVRSWAFATSVDAGTFWTLTLLRAITAFPPSRCSDDACTWGPWHDDDNFWKLDVQVRGEGYGYTLAARAGRAPEGAAFTPIVTGVVFPGDAPDRGHGGFTVDFEAEAALDHGPLWTQGSHGTLELGYDARSRLAIDAVALGARDDAGAPVDAAYAFTATASGGELQLAFRTLSGTAQRASLRTRWDATGAGRGDARYLATDGSASVQLEASECWAGSDGDLALTYDSAPPFGDPAACVFAAPLYADLPVP